jgi:hypothetical protein
MIDSDTTSSGKEFHTEGRLRFVQTAWLAFQLIAIGFLTYAALDTIFGNPIHFRVGSVCLFIGVAAWLCYSRIAWGNGIRFGDSEIVLLRGQAEVCSIPLSKVQNVKMKKRSVSFKYELDGRLRFKVVGREGFSDGRWQEFTSYFTSHVKIHKDA